MTVFDFDKNLVDLDTFEPTHNFVQGSFLKLQYGHLTAVLEFPKLASYD